MSEPIPRVSASKYPGIPETDGVFPVKFKIKGQADGPVYAGQREIVPCVGCNPPTAALTSTLSHAAAH